MVVCDLDGTLLPRGGQLDEATFAAFRALGKNGVIRVVATGRNLFSAMKAIPSEFPIDYLVFSMGAGIFDWREKKLLRSEALDRKSIDQIVQVLAKGAHDYMIHDEVPNNHHFFYVETGKINPDFQKRISIYAPYAKKGAPPFAELGSASQFLIVSPPSIGESVHFQIQAALPSHSVVRTTSPLDRQSVWTEIYSPRVSKSQAAEWIRARENIAPNKTLAVGDDYNDVDLLKWAKYARVISEAPATVKNQFPNVVDRVDLPAFLSRWGQP